jgi:hypothetical protein
MTNDLRVLVEQGPKGKRFVAHAADWPGLERGARDEDAALEKLVAYVPRYRRVAVRARLGKELPEDPQPKVIERYTGTGSTDFWGISFAPAELDRTPFDKATFERNVKLLRAVWAEFDEIAGSVSAELRPGPRGGGRDRDRIIRHILANEGGDFAKRVKASAELEELATPAARAAFRDRFVAAMRDWYVAGTPLGKWTVPYLLRHAAYHALDHAWEMEDRDLTDEAATG